MDTSDTAMTISRNLCFIAKTSLRGHCHFSR
jgi:hypothetical protein